MTASPSCEAIVLACFPNLGKRSRQAALRKDSLTEACLACAVHVSAHGILSAGPKPSGANVDDASTKHASFSQCTL
jgi:hypothetical protein